MNLILALQEVADREPLEKVRKYRLVKSQRDRWLLCSTFHRVSMSQQFSMFTHYNALCVKYRLVKDDIL